VEKQASKKRLTHEDIFRLHAIIAGDVMDQGEAGRYRTMRVRVGQLSITAAREKVVLRPRQEQLLKLLGQSGGMTPAELWAALNVSKQGAMDLLRPLLKAGLVQRVGTLKSGRYLLK
jgi:predicted HTH transcriptional regulator